MTSEPAPFLTADSIGKEYIKPNGRYYSADMRENWDYCGDIIPPAPPEPERRTVWLSLFESSTHIYPSKDAADKYSGSTHQGEAVPVNLERGADSNWSVVAELTPKQAAADAMYEALKICDRYLAKCFGSASKTNPYPALDAALAKARGEGGADS